MFGPERFELVPEASVRRSTATVNVSRADKEVFDAVQLWLSQRRKESVSQWDVFSFLLGLALEHERLVSAELFPR